MDIVSIIGVGIADTEIVTIKNNSEDAIELTDWVLRDSDENVYTFPSLTIYPGGLVRLHTGQGVNTPVDLYWNQTTAVWEAGEIASLFDAQGGLRALYTIP